MATGFQMLTRLKLLYGNGRLAKAMLCGFSAGSICIASGLVVVVGFASVLSTSKAQTGSCHPPKYTESGDLVLPDTFREWVFVGSSLTPNALNGGHALFQEYHNVYMEPCSYKSFEQTHMFPEKMILFKELQLTLPGQNASGSRTEPSGSGYFPGPLNGADVMVKDSKRYVESGGWGYYSFGHREPKAPTAQVKTKEECAYCHINSAKKDQVWAQFYPLLDK